MMPRANCLAVRFSMLATVAAVLFASFPAPARSRFSPPEPPTASQRGNTPHVVYSTLLGGADGNFDGADDVAVDANGNAIVVGQTESDDFPTRNALQDSLEGGQDAFVAKFAPDGTCLFSTFLGGDESDSASAVAVDATGAIYVAGTTSSPDFPLKNPAQSTPGGFSDAFLTKLSADGSQIVYSTRLGGNGGDSVRDLAVDSVGRAYVTGEVVAVSGGTATFPVVNPVQPEYGGGTSDAFVAAISDTGAVVLFSTLLDSGVQLGIGAGRDQISTILVSSVTGDVFISGYVAINEDDPEVAVVCRFATSTAADLQRLPFPYFLYVRSYLENESITEPERFVAKILFGLLIGLLDERTDGALPGKGTGGDSSDLMVLFNGLCHPEAPATTCDEPAAFATLDPDLSVETATNLPLLREFFLDAGGTDRQKAIYIAGDINSDRLTTVNPVQSDFGGGDDVVVAVLAPGTLEKAMVTFFGGDGFDLPTSIATDADGNIYVTGVTTLSTEFPTTPGAFQSTPKGRNDAFLVKISPVGPFPEAPDFALAFDPATVQVERGSKVSIPLLVERVGGFTGRVKITPPSQVPGFKSPKKKPTVTGDSTALKFKIKADAPLGQTSFTFTGTGSDGRVRSATVTLDVH